MEGDVLWKTKCLWMIALMLAGIRSAAGAPNDGTSRMSQSYGWQGLRSSISRLMENVRRFDGLFTNDMPGKPHVLWRSAQVCLICGFLTMAYVLGMRLKSSSIAEEEIRRRPNSTNSDMMSIVASESITDASKTDPRLLRTHSTFESYTTPLFTYPSVRTFYHPHPQAEKLPSKPTPLPLLVFVHGLGGSLAQYHMLLTSLVNVGPCLGIDLPGCGRSAYSPTEWGAYSMKALALLLEAAIENYLNKDEGQGFVLVAHSLGCSLSSLLASQTSSISSKIREHALGLVAICPRAEPPSQKEVNNFQMLLWIPDPLFNIFRLWDRRGGLESASITRYVGKAGDEDTKKLQERYNGQSRTPVFRRMAWGTLPHYDDEGLPHGGFPGLSVWAGLKMPLFLVAGEADQITKPKEVQKIADSLTKSPGGKVEAMLANEALPQVSGFRDNKDSGDDREALDGKFGGQPGVVEVQLLEDTENGQFPGSNDYNRVRSQYPNWIKDPKPRSNEDKAEETESSIRPTNSHTHPEQQNTHSPILERDRTLKISILPAPASHAMLFDHATYRTLSGLIQTFLAQHIDFRLSLGWQLQHLSTSGKWDVKNLEKWQRVAPLSEPIAGVFRAMKTLREMDEVHTPERFVQDWKDRIYAVIDISHDSPVYNPAGIQNEGIEYHKFSTVSKIPPTCDDVRDFIALVERIRAKAPDVENGREAPVIGVHCHYGFNRTGFFIASYLIERMGFTVEEAIEEFAMKRPPGIKHVHFTDELFVRYTVGLKRSPAE